MSTMITFRLKSVYFIHGEYNSRRFSSNLIQFHRKYNCKPVITEESGIYACCTEEDFLIIKLQCPEAIRWKHG